MGSVRYQVVFNNKYDFKNELKELLKSAFEQNYREVSEEELDTYIEINYEKQIDNYKYLVGFEINFDDEPNQDGVMKKIIKDFSENLKESEKINLILKFYDSDLLDYLSKVYKALFEIEMKLREIISLIFIDTYKSWDHLLKDVNIRLQLERNLLINENQRREYFNKRYENEFFYISFSEYKKLTELRDLKHEDLYLIAEISNNFDEFKQNILNRGITNKDYLEFLNNIKPILDNIEKIRNCVAHNRTIEKDLEDIRVYFKRINDHINKFLEKTFGKSNFSS